MISGSVSAANLPLLSTSAGSVERVSSFKLLGHSDVNRPWETGIKVIIAAKASKRLYFRKQLKRAGVPAQQLLHFYATVIGPVLKYCAPVWHYAITRSQAEQLESIQKRATRGMSYSNTYTCIHTSFVSELTSLESRRDRLSRSFFQDITHPSSFLYHLFPPPRDTSVLSRLKSATRFPRPISRTKILLLY